MDLALSILDPGPFRGRGEVKSSHNFIILDATSAKRDPMRLVLGINTQGCIAFSTSPLFCFVIIAMTSGAFGSPAPGPQFGGLVSFNPSTFRSNLLNSLLNFNANANVSANANATTGASNTTTNASVGTNTTQFPAFDTTNFTNSILNSTAGRVNNNLNLASSIIANALGGQGQNNATVNGTVTANTTTGNNTTNTTAKREPQFPGFDTSNFINSILSSAAGRVNNNLNLASSIIANAQGQGQANTSANATANGNVTASNTTASNTTASNTTASNSTAKREPQLGANFAASIGSGIANDAAVLANGLLTNALNTNVNTGITANTTTNGTASINGTTSADASSRAGLTGSLRGQ